MVGIDDDPGGPAYVFSVGMFHTLGHPEICIFGLSSTKTMSQIINGIGDLIKSGQSFQDWHESEDVLDEYVSIDAGIARDILKTDTNGFNSADPCWFTSYKVGPVAGEPPLLDEGPADHGALFDFQFYDDVDMLPVGATREFYLPALFRNKFSGTPVPLDRLTFEVRLRKTSPVVARADNNLTPK